MGGRWLVAALTASAVLISGCAAQVDPDELPGVYLNDKTGGKVLLNPDKTFTATDISANEATGSGGTDPLDFSGEWEFVANEESSDFVYLETKNGGLGKIGDLQLYVRSQPEVEIQPDPDGPPTLVLAKATDP